MMKVYLILVLQFFSGIILAQNQNLRELEPRVGKNLNFDSSVKEEWDLRDRVLSQLSKGEKSWDELSKEESAVLNKYGEVYEDMWDIVGGGCSWYCGGTLGEITASSYLPSQGDNSYSPRNIHDLNYKTAWVEGVPGYGIGEYIQYEFSGQNPRITEIIVANGYVKSPTAYRFNSRVKKLKMFINDEPYAILNLKDIPAEQTFVVEPIGYSDRSDYNQLANLPSIKLKFEILEVYKGDKYDDVVISEIYFDGLDVHCFAAGTQISMADGSYKSIETLQLGESVLSYNSATGGFEPTAIKEMANPVHNHMVEIQFEDGSMLVSTQDHPYLSDRGWLSFDPLKTEISYQFEEVNQLEIGSHLRTKSGLKKVRSIKAFDELMPTYTIVALESNKVYIANDILVGTEELRNPNF